MPGKPKQEVSGIKKYKVKDILLSITFLSAPEQISRASNPPYICGAYICAILEYFILFHGLRLFHFIILLAFINKFYQTLLLNILKYNSLSKCPLFYLFIYFI